MDAEIIAIANEYLPKEFKKGGNFNLQTLAYAVSSFFEENLIKQKTT